VQATGTGDSDAMRLHRSLAALRRAVATSALVVHWVTWLQTQRPTIPVTSTLRRALPVSVVPTVFCRLTDHGPKTTRAARLWQGRYLKIRWNYEKRASSISSIFLKKSIKIRKIRSKYTRDNVGTVRKSGIPINRPVSPINWPVWPINRLVF
jgi:hypothetical protein